MLDDREAWQSMIDDESTSDMDKEEAQQQIDFINEDMRNKGYDTGEQQIEQEDSADYIRQQDDSGTSGQIDQGPSQRQPTWEELEAQRRQQERAYMKKRAIRGIKKAGKFALKGGKIAAQGLGIAGGAMVGLAAGASTGDFSKAMTYMGAGALAGRSLGKAAGNLPERAYDFGKNTKSSIKDKMEEYRYNDDKDRYGVAVAAERAAIRQNERAEREFLDNKEEQAKYEEMAGRIKTSTGEDVATEDLMRAAFEYKKAGITDEKQIEAGLAIEAKYGGVNGDKHDNMIDVMNMANTYGRDYVLDDKKRASLQGMIKDNVKGEKNQNEVWDLYTQALGFDSSTRDRYAINKTSNQSRAGSKSSKSTQNSPKLNVKMPTIPDGSSPNDKSGPKPNSPQRQIRRK